MTATLFKVLLVDDEQLIRNGLEILLDSFEEIKIVGQAANGQEAADYCAVNDVNIVLMDIRMPTVNGIEGTRMIKNGHPDIKVVILTTFQDTEYISQAMRQGASGYLLKDSSPEEIREGIRIAMNNNIVLDGKLSKVMMSFTDQEKKVNFNPVDFDLSEKEVKIVRLIATGLNNQEIAQEVFLSLGTVKNNISIILNKLELRDRTQLAIFAFENGLMN